jgi:peptidoglycan/LPS O-acetylase OafA/YrhL
MKIKKLATIGLRALFPALALLTTIFELFKENEWVDKADDIIYLGIAFLALLWALFARNKTPRFFPVIFLVLALATKIIWLFIEGDDMKAVDPDYAVLVFIALSVVVNGGMHFWTDRIKSRTVKKIV